MNRIVSLLCCNSFALCSKSFDCCGNGELSWFSYRWSWRSYLVYRRCSSLLRLQFRSFCLQVRIPFYLCISCFGICIRSCNLHITTMNFWPKFTKLRAQSSTPTNYFISFGWLGEQAWFFRVLLIAQLDPGDIFEHAVVLSVKMEDQDAFERHFLQLKSYYTDTR
jgi:hypothetical protein